MSDIEKTRQDALELIEQCTREMQEAMRVEKPELAAAFGAMATMAGMAFLLGLHKPSEPATVSTCDDYPECERERDALRAERDALTDRVAQAQRTCELEALDARQVRAINAALVVESYTLAALLKETRSTVLIGPGDLIDRIDAALAAMVKPK